MERLTGRITNIQNYCVHDGPGIRTVVFMKGCPLRCTWCSNPETQSFAPELAYSPMKCIGCFRCVQRCEQGAIKPAGEEKLEIDRSRCVECHACAAACYAKALHVFGEDLTVDELFRKTHNDRAWRSNGGITVSGGEPLMQAEFVAQFLQKHRSVGTHTAVETTAFADWKQLELVAQSCKLVFCDIKVMESTVHKACTGQDNAVILENIERLSRQFPQVDLIVRTPVIPGVNDDEDSLGEIRDFLALLPHLTDYELLPYHGFGEPKYAQLGKAYGMEGAASMAKDRWARLNEEFRRSLRLPV